MATIKNCFIALIAICVMSACGGSGNSNKKGSSEKTAGDFPLEVEKTVTGPFSESIEVTNAVLKISEGYFGTKLMVEVQRTSAELPFDPNDADVCGSRSGKSYQWCISADILGESNLPVETNLGIYGYTPFEQLPSLKNGETVWLEFSMNSKELEKEPSKAKKVKLASKVEYEDRTVSGTFPVSSESETSSVSSKSKSEDWDAVLKSYEEFIDQYIKLLKKSQTGDMSALTEYAKYMEKASDLSEKLENANDELTSAQAAKFLKLQAKLANAAASAL